jgi:hypothetical protein
MIELFCFALAVLASPFKSKLRLEAENAVLRHQLIVLRRRLPGRVRLANHDRWFSIQLYRWFPSILQVLITWHPGRTSSPQRQSLGFRHAQLPVTFPRRTVPDKREGLGTSNCSPDAWWSALEGAPSLRVLRRDEDKKNRTGHH